MTKYGMIIDIDKCNGCYNCFLACRDEFYGNEYPGYAASQPETGHFWMRVAEKERGKYPKVKVTYTPIPCLHCESAPCVASAQNDAVIRRYDGIVIIDPVKSKGQRQIVDSCPYRVIYWNEEQQIPQKCNLCAHLLDAGWQEPRCVEACPTGALTFGDIDDCESDVAKLIASGKTQALHPEYGLKPNIRYINLPRKFIAGAVVLGEKDECGEGANITLRNSDAVKTLQADIYGDFVFEGLPDDTEYEIKVEHPGYKTQVYNVTTKLDVYLGDIVLDLS